VKEYQICSLLTTITCDDEGIRLLEMYFIIFVLVVGHLTYTRSTYWHSVTIFWVLPPWSPAHSMEGHLQNCAVDIYFAVMTKIRIHSWTWLNLGTVVCWLTFIDGMCHDVWLMEHHFQIWAPVIKVNKTDDWISTPQHMGLILLGLALCLPSASVSSVLMVLYRY